MNEGLSERLRSCGVLPIMRLRDHALAVRVAQALVAGGAVALELTLDHPAALLALREVRGALPGDVLLGAGTVRTREHVAGAADAGASFCVAPNVDLDVMEAAREAGLAMIPGAGTASEVALALDAGAEMVKLFPAGPLGTGYMRALLGPFEDAALLPTGGIGLGDVGRWIAAGAWAIGLGSNLVPARPAAADPPLIESRVREAIAQARAARRP